MQSITVPSVLPAGKYTPNNFKNWILQRERSRDSTIKNDPKHQYGSFLIVESRGFLKAKNPIFEVVWV